MAGRAAPGGRGRRGRARGRAELGHVPAQHHRPQRARRRRGRADARRAPRAGRARSRQSRWPASSTRSRTARGSCGGRSGASERPSTSSPGVGDPGAPRTLVRPGPPRRRADRLHVRSDRGRRVPRALPAGDPEHQDPAPTVVGRPGRAGRRDRRRAQRPALAGAGRHRGWTRQRRGSGRHVAEPGGAGRERQPLGGRLPGRTGRDAPRPPARGAARVARLSRRRGDAPGRDPRRSWPGTVPSCRPRRRSS